MASDQDPQVEEYKAILDNTARLSDRRQTTNDVFVGLNSLILTALGFFFVSTKLSSWWTTAVFATIAIFTTVINSIWLRLNGRYRDLVGIRISYLTALENKLVNDKILQEKSVTFIDSRGKQTTTVAGVHVLENSTNLYRGGPKSGFSSLERALIWVFMGTYYLLAVVVAALTYLVLNHFLPPLDFHA
jgi:fatty acid desaturase